MIDCSMITRSMDIINRQNLGLATIQDQPFGMLLAELSGNLSKILIFLLSAL